MRRVLILSVANGAGHIMAAKALAQAFAVTGSTEQTIEVRHEDVLDHSNSLLRCLYSTGYVRVLSRFPGLVGALYNYWDNPGHERKFARKLESTCSSALLRLIQEYKPDLIVNTHFMPAQLITDWRRRGLVDTPQVAVVTDLDANAVWYRNDCLHYFVALEETRQNLLAAGIPENKLTVSGIPINPVFSTHKDKMGMRRKHGLNPDLPVILVSAGGLGVGPVDQVLEQLLKLPQPAQVVVVCGNNQALKAQVARLSARTRGNSPVNLRALGFTTEMDEFMTLADLSVGKPGGLTTSECLAKGLPSVVVSPIPGQEARNSDHLLEQGAAIRCNNLSVIGWKVGQLLADKPRLQQLQENARRMGRPRAALDIVECLKGLLI